MHNAKLLQNTVFIITIVAKKIEQNGQPHSIVIINVKSYLENYNTHIA